MEILDETRSKLVSKLRYIYLLGCMHGFYLESSLQYEGFKNNNGYQ